MAVLNFLVLISMFVFANVHGNNSDYCNIKTCKQPSAHTMCKSKPLPWVNPGCGQVESSSMTTAEIKEVLDKHNELRRKVASGKETRGRNGPQPAARNLGDLVWNDELARIAQTWANQCGHSHDKCRNTHDSKVGQNIGQKGYSNGYNTKLPDIVNSWYEEVNKFDNRDVSSWQGRSPGTGHYSQLVWADSKEVGCGLIRFIHPVITKGFYRTQLICNYKPAGNMRNHPVYLTR